LSRIGIAWITIWLPSTGIMTTTGGVGTDEQWISTRLL
jgi:hypothetical protein